MSSIYTQHHIKTTYPIKITVLQGIWKHNKRESKASSMRLQFLFNKKNQRGTPKIMQLHLEIISHILTYCSLSQWLLVTVFNQGLFHVILELVEKDKPVEKRQPGPIVSCYPNNYIKGNSQFQVVNRYMMNHKIKKPRKSYLNMTVLSVRMKMIFMKKTFQLLLKL